MGLKVCSVLFTIIMAVLLPNANAASAWISFDSMQEQAIEQAVSSSRDAIEFNLRVPGVHASEVKTKEGFYTQLDFEGKAYKGEEGTPRIPVLRRIFQVPYSARIELEISTSEPIIQDLKREGFNEAIIPVQPPIPKLPGATEAAPFVIDNGMYSRDEFLGGATVRIQDDDYLRGTRLLVVEIVPLKYNPQTNEIEYVSEISLRLNLVDADYQLTQEKSERYGNAAYDQVLRQITVNPEAYRNFTFPPGAPISYLIICSSSFTSSLSSFISWKQRCGYEVVVESAPSGATTTTIKNIILNAYQTWSNPPDYVLLAGDTDTIPAFVGESSGSADDNQYTELEGTGYWTPDVMIGRFPVRSTTDIQNYLTKLMQFEQMTMPSTSYFKDSVWLASTDHASMLEATHEWCYDNHVEPLDPTNNVYYDVYERLGGDTADFASNVNAGRGIVCYSGHGYGNGTGTASVSFVHSDVQALTNVNKYGNVMVFACGTNLHDQTISFGERWLLEANKGSISYWGTSESSYWTEDDNQEREIYRCQHEDLIHTLSAMYMTGLIYVYTTGGSSAYYFDIYNLMGDPSTDFLTRIPQAPTITCAATTVFGEQDFSVTVTASGSARAGVLVGISMNGTLLGASYTNSSGLATIHFTPPTIGTATVTVTGHNLIPATASVLIANSGCGVLSLDDTVYNCNDTITLTLYDNDLNTSPSTIQTAVVDIASNTEPTPENVTLTETSVNSGAFVGTIQTSASQSGTGYLRLSHNDTITAHYYDAACEGSPVQVYDTATADCQGPTISNVQVTNLGTTSATIQWTTNEASDSLVTYGTSVPPSTTNSSAEMVTTHQLVLTGLASCTTYYFSVRSIDAFGNMTVNNNGGSYFTFTTYNAIMVYTQNMNTNPGWTVSGGQWAWGQPTGGGGSYGSPDPTAGYTGSYVYGYNLSGDYINSMPAYTLTSSAINCSAAVNVKVSFYRWLGVESSSYDHAIFSVSNNGSTWTEIYHNPTGATADSAWTFVEYDISSVADGQSNVQLRWTMGTTDSSVVYCGWNIDDVVVSGEGPCGPTVTPTRTATRTPTSIYSLTPTRTPTNSPTATRTPTSPPSSTPTITPTPGASSNVRITSSTKAETHPVIVQNSQGTLFIVYEHDYSSTDGDVYLARSSNGGQTWTTSVVNADTRDMRNPVIAIDDANKLFVTYENNYASDTGLLWSESTDGGTTWMLHTSTISGYVPANADNPAIAVKGSGSTAVLYIAFQYQGSIYYLFSIDGGGTWTTGLLEGWSGKEDRYPAIAIGSTNVVIAFESEYSSTDHDIISYYRTAAGGTWTQQYISTYTSEERYPTIAAHSNNFCIAYTWLDNGAYCKWSSDNGGTFGSAVQLAATGLYPAVSLSAAGGRIAYASGTTIRYSATTDGLTWTDQGVVTDGVAVVTPVYEFVNILHGSTQPFVVWEDSRNGNLDLYFDWPVSAPSATPTYTSTGVPTATATRTPTLMPTNTATQIPTATSTRTPTLVPTSTYTATRTATQVPTSTLTATRTATSVPTSTYTATRTATQIPTSAPTLTPTRTATGTATATRTSTRTATYSPTLTATNTATQPPTSSPTLIPTWTATLTPTLSPSATRTPTLTPTPVPPTETPNITPTLACYHDGDVNQDNQLSAADAQLAFYISLGSYQPSFVEFCSADCNASGNITAGDAQSIFIAALGSGSCVDPITLITSTSFADASVPPLPDTASAFGNVFLECSGNAGDTLTIAAIIHNSQEELDAFLLDIAYPETQLRLIECKQGELRTAWQMFECAAPTSGIVRAAGFALDTGIPKGSFGSLVELTFEITNSVSANSFTPNQFQLVRLADDVAGFTVSETELLPN